MNVVEITYFSDVLCIWAYASQARIDAVNRKFADAVRIKHRFVSVFGDTATKITSTWNHQGGNEGFNLHLRQVAERFPHIEVHPDIWVKTRPATSASAHLFMKSVQGILQPRAEGNALHHLNPESGFAVHWIDLNKFKEVNDTLGHPVGDALLTSRRTVRGNDLVARLGGDEFAVIQAGVTAFAEAEKLTKRLLAPSGPPQVLGHNMTIAVSIGVVLAPQHGSSAEEPMKNVDVALYEAKAAGGGTFALFATRTAQSAEALSQPSSWA